MNFFGIDPGLSGALAYISDYEPASRGYVKMPPTLRDIWDWFGVFYGSTGHVLIEDVKPNPKNGSISVAKLMRNVGNVEMAAVGCCFPVARVSPQKWQKEYGLIKKPNETDVAKKNRHKAAAQELFPELKITLANCDALLLALYCKRHASELF